VTLKRKEFNEESVTFWSTGEAGSVSIDQAAAKVAQAEGSTGTTTTGTTTDPTTPTDPETETDKKRPPYNGIDQQLKTIREALNNAMSNVQVKV